jgi:hypothetical protein
MLFKDYYVVSVIVNPTRSKRRAELFRKFEKYLKRFDIDLYTVEVRFGDRPWEMTFPNTKNHIQLETRDELWLKERMMNIGVQCLPDTWKGVFLIDADIEFTREDWVQETIHQLQHYSVVQMFSHSIDLGPDHEHIATHSGFVYQYLRNAVHPKTYGEWHPGFAWAWRRDAFNAVGGMIDHGICGAGDNHMAKSLIGRGIDSVHKDIHPEYANRVLSWEEKALRYIKKNIGYTPGTIMHNWHGRKVNRFYWSRWQILVNNQFNPLTDIKYDWQSLWQLETHTDRQIKLRDDLRHYFRARKEDANYTED